MSVCCNQPPAVTFVYADWVAEYPAFAAVNSAQATGYFNIATLYCANRLGIVQCPANLLQLLWLLTAHIAWLFSPRDTNGNPSSTGTQPPPATVGRISQASEGSVSISTEYASQIPSSMAWFVQTPWGAAFWQATALYRTFRYRPGVRRALTLSQIPWLYPSNPN
jgi:hypothetical protein